MEGFERKLKGQRENRRARKKIEGVERKQKRLKENRRLKKKMEGLEELEGLCPKKYD